MSVQVKHRRDTALNISTNTPAQGEIWVDLTNTALVVGDGVTVGGWRQALETYTAVADSSYDVSLSDRVIAYHSLTAPRSVALPSSGTYPKGARLTLIDLSGNASSSMPITAVPASGDQIVGLTAAIVSPFGSLTLLYDSSSSTWIVIGGSAPPLGWNAVSTSQTISYPGRYKVITSGVTLTFPSGGVGGDIVIKDASGSPTPDIALSGSFDGHADMTLSQANAAATLVWDSATSTYLVI